MLGSLNLLGRRNPLTVGKTAESRLPHRPALAYDGRTSLEPLEPGPAHLPIPDPGRAAEFTPLSLHFYTYPTRMHPEKAPVRQHTLTPSRMDEPSRRPVPGPLPQTKSPLWSRPGKLYVRNASTVTGVQACLAENVDSIKKGIGVSERPIAPA